MKKEDVITAYMMNEKHVIAEMLYDTITKYEAHKTCDGCVHKMTTDGLTFYEYCCSCARDKGDYYEPKVKP